MSNRRTSTSIQMISDYDGDLKELLDQVPSDEESPILATRNMVLFPGVIVPIMIGRKASVSLIKRLKKNPENYDQPEEQQENTSQDEDVSIMDIPISQLPNYV